MVLPASLVPTTTTQNQLSFLPNELKPLVSTFINSAIDDSGHVLPGLTERRIREGLPLLADSNYALVRALFQSVTDENGDTNPLFTPHMIKRALAMVPSLRNQHINPETLVSR